MEKQVLSIEQMQKLIELGIDVSNASMIWLPVMAIDKATNTPYVDRHDLSIKHSICDAYWRTREGKETYPTFTLEDILKQLNKPTLRCEDDNFWSCEVDTKNGSSSASGKTALSSAFNLLKHCYSQKK